ncbi:MAG: nucleotidyl transferase, partial [Chloroflexi bacterium]|nr:nucleotidyl transferase [Chloroflexota bacterium]
TRIVFCVGYLGEMLQAELGDGSQWGVSIDYSFDGPRLLGTGGALHQARPVLGEAFFVLYGDSYLECDYAAIEQAFRAEGKLGLMTVVRNDDAWDRSNVLFQDGRIVRYDKRQRIPEMRHIDYGLGVIQARAFEPYPIDQPLDLATIYQDLLKLDQLSGLEVSQRFYEIGSVTGLAETREYLLQHKDEA